MTVICVIWLIWGFCNVLNGLRDLAANHRKLDAFQTMAAENGVTLPDRALDEPRSVLYLGVLIVVVSAAGFIGAAFLLWLRSGGRVLLELANWGTVLVVAWFAWKAMAIQVMAEASRGYFFRSPSELTVMDLDGDGALNVFLTGAKLMLGAIPFLYIIKKLRQRETHEAIYSARMREITASEALGQEQT